MIIVDSLMVNFFASYVLLNYQRTSSVVTSIGAENAGLKTGLLATVHFTFTSITEIVDNNVLNASSNVN